MKLMAIAACLLVAACASSDTNDRDSLFAPNYKELRDGGGNYDEHTEENLRNFAELVGRTKTIRIDRWHGGSFSIGDNPIPEEEREEAGWKPAYETNDPEIIRPVVRAFQKNLSECRTFTTMFARRVVFVLDDQDSLEIKLGGTFFTTSHPRIHGVGILTYTDAMKSALEPLLAQANLK